MTAANNTIDSAEELEQELSPYYLQPKVRTQPKGAWHVMRMVYTPKAEKDRIVMVGRVQQHSAHPTAYEAISTLHSLNGTSVPEHHPLDALTHLYLLAERECHSGACVAAYVLLGLYNGQRFKFDMTELRRLNKLERALAMSVINFDSENCYTEIHEWLNIHLQRDDFGARFEELAHRFNIPNACSDQNRAKTLLPLPAEIRSLYAA